MQQEQNINIFPTETDQDSRTPANSNKQDKAAHNESNQAQLTQRVKQNNTWFRRQHRH
jgi:hypothetical protein